MDPTPSVTAAELAMAELVVRSRPRPAPAPAAWAERHPVAAGLEDAAPGPELVAELASLGTADLDNPALLEGAAAWERITAWAAAQQAALLAEMERRATSTQLEFVADDVAARLAVSRRVAENLLDRSRALDALPELHDALSSGSIDARRADALLRATRHRTFEDAREIVRVVLPGAARQTAPQVRDAARHAEAVLDPGALGRRHDAARRDRCVRMTPAPDAMAWVTAFLPAADAMTVMTAVDAIAAAAAPEDERTIDARRADALTDVLRRVLDGDAGPEGPLPTRHGRRPHLTLTMSARAVLDRDGLAELQGYGLVPAKVAREVARDATWTIALTDDRTGELVAPSGRGFRPTKATVTPTPTPSAATPSAATPSAATPSTPTPSAPTPTPSAPTPPGAPEGARAPHPSASVGTDGGLRAGSAGYRPGVGLAQVIVARDVTCTFVGCRIPAARCDLDHIVPFDPEVEASTQTCPSNLHALCRHHHRMKTHGSWTPARDPVTGVTTWTAPSGRVYARDPVAPAPDLDASPGALGSGARTPGVEPPPPF